MAIRQGRLEQQQDADGGAEDGMRGIGDKQIIVFFEVDRHNAIKRCQDGEGRHLVQKVAARLSPQCSRTSLVLKPEVTEESVPGRQALDRTTQRRTRTGQAPAV